MAASSGRPAAAVGTHTGPFPARRRKSDIGPFDHTIKIMAKVLRVSSDDQNRNVLAREASRTRSSLNAMTPEVAPRPILGTPGVIDSVSSIDHLEL